MYFSTYILNLLLFSLQLVIVSMMGLMLAYAVSGYDINEEYILVVTAVSYNPSIYISSPRFLVILVIVR